MLKIIFLWNTVPCCREDVTSIFRGDPPPYYLPPRDGVSRFLRVGGIVRLKCDGTRAETRFGLSVKRTNPFKSARGLNSVDCWQPSCAHQR